MYLVRIRFRRLPQTNASWLENSVDVARQAMSLIRLD